MLLKTLLLNVVIVASLLSPVAVAGPAPEKASFRGGSIGVPFTPCRIGMWWDGLCNQACGARVCVYVGHCKLVCGSVVVFDFIWVEVTVEQDGKPPQRCGFNIGDQVKGGPYRSGAYSPRCLDGYDVAVHVGWNGDEPDIQGVSCVER